MGIDIKYATNSQLTDELRARNKAVTIFGIEDLEGFDNFSDKTPEEQAEFWSEYRGSLENQLASDGNEAIDMYLTQHYG